MNDTPTDWTPVQGLLHWAQTQPDAIYLTQPADGAVSEYRWAEVAEQVRRMAAHLRAQGLPAGSCIALLSRNCAHSVMADLAIWMAGHVSVPIYPSLNADTLAYILQHSESRLLFLGPLDDWPAMRAGVPQNLPTVLLPGAASDALPACTRSWDQALNTATPLGTPATPAPGDLARLVYTSGSTGQPKGVMISFGAMAAASGLLANLTEVGPQDRMISYLPLAHVFEAAAVLTSSLRYGFQVYFSEGLASFSVDLKRARPTIFLSVPRLWVKFQQAIQARLPQDQLDVLLADPETAEPTRRQVLQQLGLQDTRIALTGSAPLPPAVMRWYHSLGLELLEGYGMSEDFAYSHLSRPGRSRMGYVGDANEGVQRRIADSGEVQLRSPGCMLGYYKEPEKTAEAFTEDGWFRTGDLGEIDEDGRLRITGRLKELFKTSKGKYVAPAPIENKLGHPQIESVCVSGANQGQPMVLMMPSPLATAALASEAGRKALEAQLCALLDQVNATLDPHEELAFAVIVAEPWNIANNLLTPTLKIRRNTIEARYAPQLEAWYACKQRVIWEQPHP